MRTTALVIVALMLASPCLAVARQADSFPDSKTYEEKKQIFLTRLPEKFTSEERAEATRICIADLRGLGGIDPQSHCSNWYGLETWYKFGWQTCDALRQGSSREFILKVILFPDNAKFSEAIFNTAVEVLCPKDVLEVYRREYEQQRSKEPAEDEKASEDWLDPKKDQLFIETMIEKLREPERSELRRTCRTYSKRCALWGFSGYGDSVCQLLREGHSRRELIEGDEQFFDRTTQQAIVDTAIEVMCPEFKGKK